MTFVMNLTGPNTTVTGQSHRSCNYNSSHDILALFVVSDIRSLVEHSGVKILGLNCANIMIQSLIILL